MAMCVNPHNLDLNGFHLDNQYFIPIIGKTDDSFDLFFHNTILIPVDLTVSSRLEFEDTRLKVKTYHEQGIKILFELKFGFFHKNVKLHIESFQVAFTRAIQIFLERLYKGFESTVLGVVLFKGNADLTTCFPFNQYHYLNLLEFLEHVYKTPTRLFETKNSPIDTFEKMHYEMFDVSSFANHQKNLYFHQFFAEYLHRLAAELPEDLLSFVWYDCQGMKNLSFLAQVLSKKRYSHLNLILENHKIPVADISDNIDSEGFGYTEPRKSWILKTKNPKVGVIFPNDENLFQSTHLFYDQVFEELFERGISYRLIPEFLVTESWQGLDILIFMNEALSFNGKRILQGFSVTGGSVVFLDNPIHLDNESSFQEFLETFSE